MLALKIAIAAKTTGMSTRVVMQDSHAPKERSAVDACVAPTGEAAEGLSTASNCVRRVLWGGADLKALTWPEPALRSALRRHHHRLRLRRHRRHHRHLHHRRPPPCPACRRVAPPRADPVPRSPGWLAAAFARSGGVSPPLANASPVAASEPTVSAKTATEAVRMDFKVMFVSHHDFAGRPDRRRWVGHTRRQGRPAVMAVTGNTLAGAMAVSFRGTFSWPRRWRNGDERLPVSARLAARGGIHEPQVAFAGRNLSQAEAG